MKLKTMEDLFKMELMDIYSAEKQVLKALPKMSKAASTPELKQSFEQHVEETQQQIERIEKIFEQMGEKPKAHTCKGMQGLIEEGQELLKETADDKLRDAGLIGAAQRVEHYEMAAYGCLRTYAQLLGIREAASLAEKTLEEEKKTDKKLTDLAERIVNREAAESSEGMTQRQRKAA